MLANHFRGLRDLPDAGCAGPVPRRIVGCFDDLPQPIFHTLHVASRHGLFRHVPKGSHSRFVPCVWGVRRDDFRWQQPEGPCHLAAFLTAAAAMAKFVLRPPTERWGGLLPAPSMQALVGRRSKLYLPDFWTLTLHHLVWSKRLPYAIRARWAQGTSIHDEEFYFVSRLPVDLVEASQDAVILFQEAARISGGAAVHAEPATVEPPVYRNGRWRLPTRAEPRAEEGAAQVTPPVPEPVEGDGVELDEETFTVRSGTTAYRFTPREKQLFALLERVARQPGRRVDFDSLRSIGDVWDGAHVEDSTIRGTVARLRKVLRSHGLRRVAGRIATGTYRGVGYVVLSPSEESLPDERGPLSSS